MCSTILRILDHDIDIPPGDIFLNEEKIGEFIANITVYIIFINLILFLVELDINWNKRLRISKILCQLYNILV